MGLGGPAGLGRGLILLWTLGRVGTGRKVGGLGAGARGPLLTPISQAKQISPELSALAVYCCATRLRNLRPAPTLPQPCQVSSLSERKAKKLIREAGRSRGIGRTSRGRRVVQACRLLVGGTS